MIPSLHRLKLDVDIPDISTDGPLFKKPDGTEPRPYTYGPFLPRHKKYYLRGDDDDSHVWAYRDADVSASTTALAKMKNMKAMVFCGKFNTSPSFDKEIFASYMGLLPLRGWGQFGEHDSHLWSLTANPIVCAEDRLWPHVLHDEQSKQLITLYLHPYKIIEPSRSRLDSLRDIATLLRGQGHPSGSRWGIVRDLVRGSRQLGRYDLKINGWKLEWCAAVECSIRDIIGSPHLSTGTAMQFKYVGHCVSHEERSKVAKVAAAEIETLSGFMTWFKRSYNTFKEWCAISYILSVSTRLESNSVASIADAILQPEFVSDMQGEEMRKGIGCDARLNTIKRRVNRLIYNIAFLASRYKEVVPREGGPADSECEKQAMALCGGNAVSVFKPEDATGSNIHNNIGSDSPTEDLDLTEMRNLSMDTLNPPPLKDGVQREWLRFLYTHEAELRFLEMLKGLVKGIATMGVEKFSLALSKSTDDISYVVQSLADIIRAWDVPGGLSGTEVEYGTPDNDATFEDLAKLLLAPGRRSGDPPHGLRRHWENCAEAVDGADPKRPRVEPFEH